MLILDSITLTALTMSMLLGAWRGLVCEDPVRLVRYAAAFVLVGLGDGDGGGHHDPLAHQ
jgi:hypothetical protein